MESIELFIEKMRKEHLPQAAIDTFKYYYSKLQTGSTGLIPENEIDPVLKSEIHSLTSLSPRKNQEIRPMLAKVVCIKLNGGLGTTMGLQGPKSLIPVKENQNFLDITSNQITAFNNSYDIQIPLILMNSFKTEEESLNVLKKHPDIFSEIPISFIQHKFPKILVSSLLPASYPANPDLEWNPPGHGDLYIAFETSGILTMLLEKGYKYAFISNIDNLGASLDPTILNYIVENEIQFLMEVTDRTDMDRKGGHLARLKNSRLILREAAQCPENEIEQFRDINRYCYFNTNNLWIDLLALKNKLSEFRHFLDLPMIRNKKKLNPIDNSSPEIYQIESAMGTAISTFDKATAIRVPRNRFAPVKNCEELLLLWSDAFIINQEFQIIPNPNRKYPNITIHLDPNYYSFLHQLNDNFPSGAPSLVNCKELIIKGNIRFGKNVKIRDSVTITNNQIHQISIPDNSVISEDIEFR